MKKILFGNELLIIFAKIGDATFGINIQNVISIIEPGKTRMVPFAPVYINSIVNYYGRIITIFDIDTYLTHESEKSNINKKIIYLSNTNQHIGLLVDEIVKIEYVAPSCIESMAEEDAGSDIACFCQDIFILEEDALPIYWLDTKKIANFINNIKL